MNWDDLKVFLTVVRQPNLEKAAPLLHLDATTISRRVKRLEASLGTTLFERTRKGHILTTSGEILARSVEDIETLTLDITAETPTEQSASGRIRLGVPEGLGTTIIAPALAQFKQRHPYIDVDLIALSGFVSVPKREADMSLLLTRPTAGRLKIRRLANYNLGLFGAPEYVRGASAVITLDDLKNHILVGYVDDLIYSSQLRYFGDLLPDLTPNLSSTSINAQLQLVRSGAGLGILPKFMAEQVPGLLHLLPAQICVERTFWLATHQDVASLTRNRLMSDFLANTLKSLP